MVQTSEWGQEDDNVKFWAPVFGIRAQGGEHLHGALTVADVRERAAASLLHDVLEYRGEVVVSEVLE
jgi:hypothetical protein